MTQIILSKNINFGYLHFQCIRIINRTFFKGVNFVGEKVSENKVYSAISGRPNSGAFKQITSIRRSSLKNILMTSVTSVNKNERSLQSVTKYNMSTIASKKGDGDVNNVKQTFTARTNPVTGKTDWIVHNENYDYIQEIARSGYGDMLHDKDRNDKYYKAIRQAIQLLRERNKEVKSLDIGTGTGLLSMMSATLGADTVTACEAFAPMAACARQVLEVNGFANKIKLIPKRSTDVTLEDIGEKANLLVTELFDTELIGEGAIGSYTDAHNRLMEDDCVAVPSTGIMYIQAVQSDLLASCNTLWSVPLPNNTAVVMPESLRHCSGALLLHDLQVDEFKGHIKPLTPPLEVFRFDFSGKNDLSKSEQKQLLLKVVESGQVDAFVMWWDLIMDPQGEIVLSCAPCWMRDPPVPWRDHWMQAVYYPSTPTQVEAGGDLLINCCHDEYSLWFDTLQASSTMPPCSCGLHVTLSRNRIGQMNETRRNEVFIRQLEKHITQDTVCLVISDGSLLSLFAAKLGAKKVFYLDCNHSTRKLVKNLINSNDLHNRVIVLEKDVEDILSEDLHNSKIDLVVAEPFFQAALLPWEHMYFWYAMHHLRSELSSDVVILPQSMSVMAVAIQLRDLHKIRAPVGTCEGFDISEFDQLIELSSETTDNEIEPHPLYEYPCIALCAPTIIATLDFTKSPDHTEEMDQMVDIVCTRAGKLNGLALWSVFKFDDEMLSTGLSYNRDTKRSEWNTFCKQGVKIFRNEQHVEQNSVLKVSVNFTPKNGDFSIKVVEQ